MDPVVRWKFGEFEIDVRSAVLTKRGVPVRIRQQAFRALALLVSKGGQLVTREQLQREIWGDSLHGDFDHGLNVCIREVRAALGDDVEGRRIIVTCPREGYRLGVPVKGLEDGPAPSAKQWLAGPAAAGLAAAAYLLVSAMSGNQGTVTHGPPSSTNRAGVVSEGTRALDPPLFSAHTLTRRADATEWYWRGRGYYEHSTGGNPFDVLPYFARAVRIDPDFALAQAGLAVAYVDRAAAGVARTESIAKAERALDRALDLSSQTAETHVALAELLRLKGDDSAARQEFLRAIALDHRNPYVRQRYARFLQEHRKPDDALEQLRIARDVDPQSPRSSWQMSETLFSAGRFQDSLTEAYHTLELDPRFPGAFRSIGRGLEALGRREDAIKAYSRSGRVGLDQLGRLYALSGRRSAALEVLGELVHESKGGRSRGIGIAYIYTGLGEFEKAVAWLEKAHLEGVQLPSSLRAAPEWAPLRTSRVFQEFLARTPVAGS